jgi:hypothetical protein
MSVRGAAARRYVIEYAANLDPKFVISEVMNGLDLLFVDPQVYPLLEPFLQDYLTAFRQQKDKYRAKKIEGFLSYIREEPNRAAVERMLTDIPRERTPPPPVLSAAQVSREVDHILRDEAFRAYPEDELPLILEGLRQRAREFIGARDYASAHRAEQLARAVLSHGQLTVVEQLQEEKFRAYERLIEDEQERLGAEQQRWDELRENLRQQANAELAEMKVAHQAEIERLEALKAEPPPPAFRKLSAELLQLRRRERAMIQVRKYREAGLMKERAAELEAQENDAIQRRWIADIDQRIANVRATQLRQLRARRAFWRAETAAIASHANKETHLGKLQIVHLQDTLKGVESAKTITTDLKREHELRRAGGRPTVVGRMSEMERVAVHGQRRILNKKIYTMSPKGGKSRIRPRAESVGL